MPVDDEVVVDCIGEETHRGLVDCLISKTGQYWTQRVAKRCYLRRPDLSIDVVRVVYGLPVVHYRRLHTPRQSRKPVTDRSGFELVSVDRKSIGFVSWKRRRIKPEDCLALRREL